MFHGVPVIFEKHGGGILRARRLGVGKARMMFDACMA